MIGQRIAYFRKLRRFTQQQLASRTHVSVSLLSKVEAGLRPATPALVAALAPALSVSVSELNGQPYFRNAPGAEQIHSRIPALHGALARYDLPLEESRPPRTASELREDVGQVNGLRQSGSYSRLAAILPDLIDEACRAAHVAHGSPRKDIFRSLAAIYFAAHSVAYKLGYDQLATICEDRIVWAANESQDSLWIAVANWTRCTSFLATGGPGYRAGLQLLSATRRTLEDDLPREDPALLSVYGALHLREAILAARAADPSGAWAHLDGAREAVSRGARDVNKQYLLTCGPVNARIVEVAVAVELGDSEAAISRARNLVIPDRFPAVRAGHHYIDLARAFIWKGSRDMALEALLTAERYAPQQTKHHPMTHETLGLLVQQGRRSPENLVSFVNRVSRSKPDSPLP